MKQLAFILVFALLICACGCQPSSLSGGGETTAPSETNKVTEPSTATPETEPSQTEAPETEPSETGNCLGGEDPTQAEEDPTQATELPGTPIEFLTLVEDDGIYGDPDEYEDAIGIMRSREECPDWILELLNEKAEDYGEDYFDDHTVVVTCGETATPQSLYRAAGVSETEDGRYLLHLELCWIGSGGNCVSWQGRVAIVVNCAIPEDADIQVVTTSVIMSSDEFEAYFGDTGC